SSTSTSPAWTPARSAPANRRSRSASAAHEPRIVATLRPVKRIDRVALLAVCACAFVFGVSVSVPTGAQEGEAPSWRERAASEEILGNEQEPQDFLIRANWLTRRGMDADEVRRRRGIAQQAVRYRTEKYGYFQGFG